MGPENSVARDHGREQTGHLRKMTSQGKQTKVHLRPWTLRALTGMFDFQREDPGMVLQGPNGSPRVEEQEEYRTKTSSKLLQTLKSVVTRTENRHLL